MENKVQPYAWGSRTAIARLCGRPTPSDSPEAELWMGAHPKAPSKVFDGNRWMRLDDLIAAAPQAVLGDGACRRFGGRMPFLFKVLAAAAPLSIQAHPSKSQAKAGYEREDRQGIPLDAPHRNYRDPSAKPEIICALTPFWGLNGFRPVSEIRRLLDRYSPALGNLLPETDGQKGDRAGHLQAFFRNVMGLQKEMLDAALTACLSRLTGDHPDIEQWIRRLDAAYPGDVGVLSPLWLNVVRLAPGEAMFLPAGQLHAYLEGTGIELMANSDNVLRGGLTPKHVDVPELMRTLVFTSTSIERLMCTPQQTAICRYQTPADDFQLSVIRGDGPPVEGPANGAVQVLLVTEGRATVSWGEPAAGKTLVLDAGASALVPAAAGAYRVSGKAVVFVAGVPVD